MHAKIRLAILGAGYMARRHAHNLAREPEAALVAVCDVRREAAEALCAELRGEAAPYEDFDRMLAETAPEAIYVCLPPFAHEGQVEEAAGRGIHLFLEKPIALTAQRAASMVLAVQRAGVVAQVGYHMRFGAAVRELRRMIEDGTAGRPALFDARYDCNSLHGPWWRDAEKSGGQVLEQAIHLYDLALHFLGEPSRAAAFTANLCHGDVPGYTVEDTSAAAICFKNGSLAGITASNCAVPMEWNSSFTVVCEKVTAYFTDPNRAEFVRTDADPPERFSIRGDVEMYVEETRAFLASVRGRGLRVAPIEEGYLGVRLVEAVVASAKAGGTPRDV
ncbi:MAG: Gfo/Idh/MocA family protein [Bacteroidota bacterium]